MKQSNSMKKRSKNYFRGAVLLLFLFSVSVAIQAQNQKITIPQKQTTILSAFEKIEEQTNMKIAYNEKAINVNKNISIDITGKALPEALSAILKETNMTFRIQGKQIMIVPVEAPNLTKKYTGIIIDDKGEPVIGASIVVKGSSVGTATDIDGKFSIEAPAGSILSVSYIGYTTQEIRLENQSDLQINLMENSRMLEEVVVVGYGTQRKTHLSGAVSTISSKALANRPVTNASLALQGLAPNVNIRSANGNPLQTPEINVRGYTSINGGSALILVDNVPMSSSEFSTAISPSDIESVSVLKDAASAAIYGARAAYGVILVTTKTAKSNKLEISADLNYGVRSEMQKYKYNFDIVNFMDVINLAGGDGSYTAQQIEYARQRMANPSLPDVRVPNDPTYPSLDDENRYDYYAMTDWHELITRNMPSTINANISVGQRTDRMNFMTSASFYQAEGIYTGEKPIKRYHIKAGGNYKLFDRWSVGANITFSRMQYDLPYVIGNNGAQGAIKNLSTAYIKNPPKNPDGTWTESGGGIMGELLDGGRYVSAQNHIQFLFNTQFDVLKDVFVIKGDANIRLAPSKTEAWQLAVPWRNSPNTPVQYSHTTMGKYMSGENTFTTLNLYGDFHKTFGGKHFVQALAGFNQDYRLESSAWVSQEGFVNEKFPTIALATGTISREQKQEALALRGVFGRLNYTLDNRYIVEFNGRYDGTSRYAKGRRFGFFPSVTGAWIASNEPFFDSVKDALKISFLKFRGSYGSLGNQASGGYYTYFSTMDAPSRITAFIDGNRPLSLTRPKGEAASDLTWETVRTVNFGLNLGLFKDRLSIEFDRYTRYTEGMLAPAKPIPAQFGAKVATTNAADLKTKGWELDLSWRDEIKVANSPLSYSVRVMISDARAWITKYDNPSKVLSSWREGQEVGEIWGYDVPGLFQSDEEAFLWHDQAAVIHRARTAWRAGDMKFNDLDGNGKIDGGKSTEDDPGDRRIIGNNQVRLPYSFDITANWKDFDFRVFFQGIGKRDWYPVFNRQGSDDFWSNYKSTWKTPSAYIDNHWTPENPNGYYPRQFLRFGQATENAEWFLVNTRYLQDASYLRLKNFTVGYSLPKELTSKWGISRMRVYFSGENLWTVSHLHVDAIDPEVVGYGDPDNEETSMYPMQKVFSFGLNINF